MGYWRLGYVSWLIVKKQERKTEADRAFVGEIEILPRPCMSESSKRQQLISAQVVQHTHRQQAHNAHGFYALNISRFRLLAYPTFIFFITYACNNGAEFPLKVCQVK